MHPSISDGSLSPASFRRQIEAVKDGVRIEDVAADHGEFKLTGTDRLSGRCVSPEHEDRTPSMTLYTEGQRFKCYGCGAYGDVIDLVMLAEPGTKVWEAMMVLSQRHGIDLPPRPPAWFARQERQKPVRDGLGRIREEVLRRRLFRLLEPMVAGIADDEERALEAAYVWRELTPLAARMVREGGWR